MPTSTATFDDSSTAVYLCNFLSDGLKQDGETRRPVSVMVKDSTSYPMTQGGIDRAMLHARGERARQSKPVVCLTTGEQFESVHAATRAKGVSRSSISYSISHGTTPKGTKWRYA